MEKLLIVDDDDEIRTQMKWGFSKEYAVTLAKTGNDALAWFKKNIPHVVTLDLGLPPHENGTEEGFRCLEEPSFQAVPDHQEKWIGYRTLPMQADH